MAEVVNIKDFEREYKKNKIKSQLKDAKNKVINGCMTGVNYIVNHPGEIAAIGSAIGITSKVVRKIGGAKEQYAKDHRRYDHSSRHYVKTKYMSNKDWARFDALKKETNLTDTEILKQMNKLK